MFFGTPKVHKLQRQQNNYLMSIISKILQQELNDNQSKNTTAETNATPNNVQLILSYFAEADLGLLQHPS